MRNPLLKSNVSSPSLEEFSIGLTQFIDFVICKDMQAKILCAARIYKQIDGTYDHWKDYYKPVKYAILAAEGKKIPESVINELCKKYPNRSLRGHFEGYNKFIGNKKFIAVRAERMLWSHNGLTIRVLPELIYYREDEKIHYKLFMKEPKPDKRDMSIVYQLLSEVIPEDGKYKVLDVRNGRIVPQPKVLPNPSLSYGLKIEAENLLRLLRDLC